MAKPFRLFHFDIATQNNFGDTLLFPATKAVFEAFGAGNAFEIYDSRPLRERVGPALVNYINDTADAVLVGGGGLFLSDTNPNAESGWQWRISMEMLQRLTVPIIVFAVGYNRFYGQPEFEPPFRDHIRATLDKSVFFGLRNHGSIERLGEYVDEDRAGRIRYQPCATTLARDLLPVPEEQPDIKRLGVQLRHGERQLDGGITAEQVLQSADLTLKRLADLGWQIVELPFAKGDPEFMDGLAGRVRRSARVELFGTNALERGIGTLASVPFVLGTRGHAQMVPFGMGALPFSLDVHPKLGYFLNDIGHPEWVQDCTDPERFADAMVVQIESAWEDRAELREELAATRRRLLETTQHNLHDIYTALGGDPAALPQDPAAPTGIEWLPYSVQAAHMATSRFLLEVQRENSILRVNEKAQRIAELHATLEATRERLRKSERDNATAASDRAVLQRLAHEARLAQRAAEAEAQAASREPEREQTDQGTAQSRPGSRLRRGLKEMKGRHT